MCALPEWGVLEASGLDAMTFLQGQLTQDVLLMQVGTTNLAGFCSAKGRLEASFWLYKRSSTSMLLLIDKGILQSTLKRLSIFIMRTKVTLLDVSQSWHVQGVVGALDGMVGGNAESIVLTLPTVNDQPRAIVLHSTTNTHIHPIDNNTTTLKNHQYWLHLEVCGGITTITPNIVGEFVPQMLNYESVGGIHFKKGCYPGQEVVARSQYRGALKKRTFLFRLLSSLDGLDISVGQEIWHSGNAEEAAGTVVQLAKTTDCCVFLACMHTSCTESGTLNWSARNHVPTEIQTNSSMQLLPLPYALISDV